MEELEATKTKYPLPQTRPFSLPEEAWWDEDVGQWAVGKKPEKGEPANDNQAKQLKDGAYTYFHENGIKSSETKYFHGKTHGFVKRFHPNGEISMAGLCCHGKLHDLWIFAKSTEETEEIPLPASLPEEIWFMQVIYEMGMIRSLRYFTKWEEEVDAKGKTLPKRPKLVPEEAEFHSQEQEWAVGIRSQDGKRQGPWTYFRLDGTRACQTHYVDDVAHGPYQRFHENGETSQMGLFVCGKRHGICIWQCSTEPSTEKVLRSDMEEKIWTVKTTYDHGVIVRFQYFTKNNLEVNTDGTQTQIKPYSVDEQAFWDTKKKNWSYGVMDGQTGKKVGLWRSWDEQGMLIKEEQHPPEENISQ